MKNIDDFETLAEFLEYFKDEESCREHFTAIRFRNGEFCPHCGHKKIYSFASGKRYRCASCKEDFTIKTGTVFGESKLPLKKWFIAIYLLSTTSKGISSIQLAKHVGVTQKTGWFMDHRLRAAMQDNDGQLFGTVEADETFVGGKEKNKHACKRKHEGRGHTGKTIVFGVASREGKAKAKIVQSVDRPTLHKAVRQIVEQGSQIFTDEHSGYVGMPEFDHDVVNHKTGEFSRGAVHTANIDSFWALFKRGYHGVYHWMSRKHMQRYVDEFAFRWNARSDSIENIFTQVIYKVAESEQLSYKELIA